MSQISKSYQQHLYVLRLWQEAADTPWRAMLRPAGGGERLVFSDIEHLAIFLLCVTNEPEPKKTASELVSEKTADDR